MAASRPPQMPSLVEALEPRIAPATIVIGPTSVLDNNGVSVPTGAQDYTGSSFKAASVANDQLFPVASSTSHFYLDLKAGDTVRLDPENSPAVDFVKVSSGRAYAFFFDSNGNDVPEANELTGMVASSGAKVTVLGSINGSFLANLDANTGKFSSTSLATSPGKTASIAQLVVTGNIGQDNGGTLAFGNVLAGGSISNLTAGRVNAVQSGTPSDLLPDGLKPVDFHLGGAGQTVGQGTIAAFLPSSKTLGGSLSGITLNAADSILAGPGSAGAPGGNISNVRIIADPDGVVIRSGFGGDGGSLAGGAGGAVSGVLVEGIASSTPNAAIKIQGGQGGDSISSAGGTGGMVSNVWVGYEYNTARKLVISSDLLQSNILVQGGEGGSGTKGGAGGSLAGINLVAAPPEDGLVDAEIRLLGGNGGALTTQGNAAGAGGSVSRFNIQNLDADSAGISDVFVKGGDASSATIVATGVKTSAAAGGSILNPVAKANEAWLVAQSIAFQGGAGSSTAARGGAGGSVTNLYFGFYANQLLTELSAVGGAGGDASLGSGGAGGRVSGVYVPIAELSTLALSGGAGGDGALGNGGAGGSLASVQIFDKASVLLPVVVTAGDGGLGSNLGGAGGGVSNFSYFGASASLQAVGGAGGNGSKGGGAGGALSGIAFSSGTPLTAAAANLLAGGGGSALSTGNGGNGGKIFSANVQASGDVKLRSGTGGLSAGGGTPGSGGAIGGVSSSSGVFARSATGSVVFEAGNAGQPAAGGTPKLGAAGGGITNAVGSAAEDLAFRAGNGVAGGAGGSISGIGFYGSGGIATSFSGDLDVRAGKGGDPLSPNAPGGSGGNILNASGTVSSTPTASVSLEAGLGGGQGVLVGSKGGNGGSVSGLTIFAGASPFSVLAGGGGDGNNSGGAGGSVQKIASSPPVNVTAIAAGEGGDAVSARGKGGSGGSVSKVDLAGDLGARSGVAYGFATDGSKAGGLFVGRGGVNTTLPADASLQGKSGNATNITAEAISSIVAGRGASPFLAGTVDGIFLRGNTTAKTDPLGAFVNIGSANFVGSKEFPAAAGAVAFHYSALTPTPSPASNTVGYAWAYGATAPADGLIAASTLTANRNFLPLAFLTNVSPANAAPNYMLFVPIP